VVQGAVLQDFLGYGRIGSGHNLIAGPVRVMVRKEDAARAAEVLAAMDRPPAGPAWWDQKAADGEADDGEDAGVGPAAAEDES
jgi:hypothetical protein